MDRAAEAVLDTDGRHAVVEARRAIALALATAVDGGRTRAQGHLRRLGARLDGATLLDANQGR